MERLRRLQPGDVDAAIWMTDFLEIMGEHEAQLEAISTGLALEPGQPELASRRVVALVELDRVTAAERALAALPAGAADSSVGRYAAITYGMRADPLAEVDRLLTAWEERSYSDEAVAIWLTLTAQAGALEAVRQRIEAHLFAADTPGDAWGGARPWFDDAGWPDLLERYLARRTEALPGLLRLQLYDPMTERTELLALADRVRQLDHPLVQYVDSYYFALGPRGAHSHAESAAALERHLAEAPDHTLCRAQLAATLSRVDPARSRAVLDEMEGRATDDPALLARIAVQRAELSLLHGSVVLALSRIQEVDPGGAEPYSSAAQIDLQAAEIAFHAGNDAVFEERLARVLEAGDASAHAAALVLSWGHQLVAGKPVTYRRDVDDYLELYGGAVARQTSPSAQAILVAEGRVRRADVEPLIAREQHSTLDLVPLLRDAGAGHPDPDAFARLAAAPQRYEYAPMIARTVKERSDSL